MILYHTVEDRDNPDQIEAEAPFLCARQSAWLGSGYYLWEQFLQHAHWWGDCAYRKRGKSYVVVQFECVSPQEGKCFDLFGNTEHLKEFGKVCEYLKSKNLPKTITVPKVIEFMRSTTDFNKRYDSIRARDNNVGSDIVKFQENKSPYMELCPRIQLCLFSKSSLRLGKGRIIYPDHYIQDDLYI